MQNEPGQPVRLSRAQVREIDRRAIEEYHVPGIVLMENAARAVVDAATDMLRGVKDPAVMVLCGGGNNGGDGLAVARHLHNRGVYVEFATHTGAAGYSGDAKINRDIVAAMGLENPAFEDADIPLQAGAVDLIVDALYGALGILAASQGTMNNLTFGDARLQYYETIAGGAGAGPGFDGCDAVQTHMTNSRLTDPEVLEWRFPVRLESFRRMLGSGQ